MYAWTDEDEIAFLHLLGRGKHTIPEQCRGLDTQTRLDLLQRYQRSIDRRQSWGSMNPNRIAAACRAMIRDEAAQSPRSPK